MTQLPSQPSEHFSEDDQCLGGTLPFCSTNHSHVPLINLPFWRAGSDAFKCDVQTEVELDLFLFFFFPCLFLCVLRPVLLTKL